MSKLEAILDLVLDAITDEGDLDHLAAKAAAMFCGMSDDGQARFFSEVASIMDRQWGSSKMLMQARYIGRHLCGCTCATTAGRDFVQGIFDAMCEEATPVPAKVRG